MLKLKLDDRCSYPILRHKISILQSSVSSITHTIGAQGHVPPSPVPDDANRYSTFGLVNILVYHLFNKNDSFVGTKSLMHSFKDGGL